MHLESIGGDEINSDMDGFKTCPFLDAQLDTM